MKIALAYSPFLLSRTGGLQEQLLSIYNELYKLDVNVKLFSIDNDNFSNFDLVHIFDAETCNFRLVEEAKKHNTKIIVSSIIAPNESQYLALRDDLIEKSVKLLSHNSLTLTKEQTRWSLNGADAIIALGEVEKNTLQIQYGINKNKIHIISNGVSNDFFSPITALFTKKYNINKDFILCVGSIYPLKNQLKLAEITKELGKKLILVGDIRDQQYFEKIKRYTHVEYLGVIKDKNLLASAYASASLLSLISEHEIMPLVVLEAIASNTPILMTDNHSMSIDLNLDHIKEVDISNDLKIKEQLQYLLDNYTNRSNITRKPTVMSWTDIAKKHLILYRKILNQ